MNTFLEAIHLEQTLDGCPIDRDTIAVWNYGG